MVEFLIFILALVVTLTVHEASHALVAYYLGDPTAKFEGRLSLNPMRHLDLMGSLIFLVTQRIGWGKPVPVNPANFKNPVRDNALTALAGPASNFVFAFFIAILWKYTGNYMPDILLAFIQMLFHVNLYLGIFNLFPFPPLDGSNILGLFVPKRWHRQYLNYLHDGLKYFIAIILIDVFILGGIFNFSVFVYVMTKLHDFFSALLLLGT